MMSAESGGVPQELVRLAEQSAATQLTETALGNRFGRRSTWLPSAGQLWRAVHEDVTALVLLLAVDVESVTAVPVTVDATDVDPDTVVFERSTFGVPLTVWTGLGRSLPMNVLDRPVDDLGAVAVQQVKEVAAVGAAPVPGLTASDVRAELDDDLAALATARPQVEAAPVPAKPRPVATGIDLAVLDPRALNGVAARLGVPLPIALDLIRGKRPATPEQADVLRETLGGSPEAAPPPAGLVVELTQPRWRGLVRQHRHRGDLSEPGARRALAYEINAMAARQTGDREPSWPDRIRRWAEAQRLDVDAEP